MQTGISSYFRKRSSDGPSSNENLASSSSSGEDNQLLLFGSRGSSSCGDGAKNSGSSSSDAIEVVDEPKVKKRRTLVEFGRGESFSSITMAKVPAWKSCPCEKWGALLDNEWTKWFPMLSPGEKRVTMVLNYIQALKNVHYSPSYKKLTYVVDMRPPGSGVFALDQVRASGWNPDQQNWDKSWVLVWENFYAVLQGYVNYQCKYFASHVDPTLDDLYVLIKGVMDLGKDSAGFKLIAFLFFDQSWWVTGDRLKSRYHFEQEISDDIVGKLETKKWVVRTPTDLADSIDLLNSAMTKQVLYDSTKKNLRCKSSVKKSGLLDLVWNRGPSFAHTLGKDVVAYRLCREFHAALVQCHMWMFGKSGFSSEEVRALVRTKRLEHVNFAQPLCDEGIPRKDKTRKAVTENNDKVFSILSELEQRKNYFKAWTLLHELELYVAYGDDTKAYVTLHKASTALMRLMNGCEEMHEDELEVLVRVCFSGCNLLEREKRYEDAAHYLTLITKATEKVPALFLLYCETVLRLAKDCNHRGQVDRSLKLVEAALKNEKVTGCALHPADLTLNRMGGVGLSLFKFCQRLSVPPRRWRLAVKGIDQVQTGVTKTITIPQVPLDSRQGERGWQGGVEQAVLDYYAKEGWNGFHCENGFGLTVFSILLWDIILSSIDTEQVCNPFMELPRPVSNGTWIVENDENKRIVQERLNEFIENGHVRVNEVINRNWTRFHQQHIRGMNWDRNTKDELIQILSGVPAKAIAMICACYAEHYQAWNGGLPDLLLWKISANNVHTRFCEVKGPGDSLRDNQRAWIDKLAAAGADIEVCFVKA